MSTTFKVLSIILVSLIQLLYAEANLIIKIPTNQFPESGSYTASGHTWIWGVDNIELSYSSIKNNKVSFLTSGKHKVNYSTRTYSEGALSQFSQEIEFDAIDGHSYELLFTNSGNVIIQDVTPMPSDSTSNNTNRTDSYVEDANTDAIIYFASLPPIAEVYLKGKLVGRTNVEALKLPTGTHTLIFVKGQKEIMMELTLKPGKNSSKLIRFP